MSSTALSVKPNGVWEPQPGPQAAAISARFVIELLYGGARGGGKTSFLLGDYLQDTPQGAGWKGIIFRRTYPEMEELLAQAKEMYLPLGATYKVSERTFIFPTGATLKLRHLDGVDDARLYQGHEYSWIGWDELGNWPDLAAYNMLKACLRGTDPTITHRRIRATANPGGPGHHAVKNYFIAPAPQGYDMLTSETGTTRIFIPAKVSDNQILLSNDPDYPNRLREVGSPALVRAWLQGDWNVITGAYFPEFSTYEHTAEFRDPIPAYFQRFRMGDWGSAKPFAFYWGCITDGSYTVYRDDPLAFGQTPFTPPKGALLIYREWYGCVPGMLNTGVRYTASRVAAGIKERTPNLEKITYGVMDPAAFKQDGGPSHAEVMARNGVFFRPADNTRIAGWNQIRERLTGEDADPDVNNGVGIPMLVISTKCPHLIRTLPALQHDDKDPEDCDTEGEDHPPDALRYGCMSRPWTRPAPAPSVVTHKPNSGYNDPTLKAIPATVPVTLDGLFQDRENITGNYGL